MPQQFPKQFRLQEVVALTGRSRTSIWRSVRAETFPPPVYLFGDRVPTWSEPDLVRHLAESRKAAGLPDPAGEETANEATSSEQPQLPAPTAKTLTKATSTALPQLPAPTVKKPAKAKGSL